MQASASQLGPSENISSIPIFVIPQINGFGESQIQFKDPHLRRIPSSRLPQPVIALDQLKW
jgi:hypothetical protein